MFHKIFVEMIGKDTQGLRDVMEWQNFCTFYVGKDKLTTTTYNFDDVANKKGDAYYLSNFTLEWETLDKKQVLQKYKDLKQPRFIPEWQWKDVDPSKQKPLRTEDLMAEKHS